MSQLNPILVLDFSSIFPGEKFDIIEALKTYKREYLIKMAFLLNCHYGNLFIPGDETIFSSISEPYLEKLNEKIANFKKREKIPNDQKLALNTLHTSTEFLRLVFSIKKDEFKGNIKNKFIEIILFKILLSINEKIYSNAFSRHGEELDEAEKIYCSSYISNNINEQDFANIVLPQLYYVYMLEQFCKINNSIKENSKLLFEKWGIKSWREYAITLFFIAFQTEQYRKDKNGGIPSFHPQDIKDSTGLFSASLIDSLSICEDDILSYNDPANTEENNTDYKAFRSRPFIKFKDNEGYIVTSIRFISERIFNSIYFDFLNLINSEENIFDSRKFKKEFIEDFVFRNTIYSFINNPSKIFPQKSYSRDKESDNEPDFYYRTGNKAFIFECKSIKMNGQIKDTIDSSRLLEELKQKIVLTTKRLAHKDKENGEKTENKAKAIGIGQLTHHISSIVAKNFKWDTETPDGTRLYPILVFDDNKIIQPGLFALTNKWFDEELQRNNLDKQRDNIAALITVNISTLYFCHNEIKNKGLEFFIDGFIQENAQLHEDGKWKYDSSASFEWYMQNNKDNSDNVVNNWILNG